jgi:hypothetical protein
MNRFQKVLSFIDLREKVENEKAYRTATKEYYPAYIRNEDGDLVPALFTASDIKKATTRASKNIEDVGVHVETSPSIWTKLFG